jgi:hypothetical protein
LPLTRATQQPHNGRHPRKIKYQHESASIATTRQHIPTFCSASTGELLREEILPICGQRGANLTTLHRLLQPAASVMPN